MVVAILMPRQGQSVESCIITRWHKSKGDKVSAGDILFSYETDKAAFEEEAKDEGILLDIFFGEGDEVPVLETVAVIGKEGDDYQSLIPSGFAGQTDLPAQDGPSETVSQAGEKDASTTGSSAGNGTGQQAGSGSENADTGQKTVLGDAAKPQPGAQSGREKKTMPDAGPDPDTRPKPGSQSGREDKITPDTGTGGDKITPDTGTGGDRIKISPLARRMAGELDLPLTGIRGTGPLGRIIERDIKKAAAEIRSESLQAGESLKVRSEDEPYYRSDASQGASPSAKHFTLRKLSNMRRIIARRMEESLRNSAQLTHHMSADARKMLAWRREIKASREAAGKTGEAMPDIGINDMVCHAVIRALKSHPYMNAHFTGDGIREFSKVHLGIAVDTPRGLMVPVLENADDMNVGGLAERIRRLAGECREGSVDPELLSSENASFTVTNLGSYGVEMFTPVLNLPQVGILGVNAITLRPADLGDGATGFIPMIGISLTYDHRAVDGAPASVFLAAVKKEIEETSAGRI